MKLLDLLFKPQKKAKAKAPTRVITKVEPPPPAPIRHRQSATDPAPIIDEPFLRGVDLDFRREGDAPYIYRVNQSTPKGFPLKFAEYVKVAGASYRQPAIIDFIAGRARRLDIRPEVFIEGEPPALAVYGLWEDWNGAAHEAHLGYVPSEINEVIGDMPIAVTLEAMYQATADRSAGLRMDIWRPRDKKGVTYPAPLIAKRG
jgi:hypothetical protein